MLLRDLLTIAVTGGVACGKTVVCRQFIKKFPQGRVIFFSCDEAVRDLLDRVEVRDAIAGMGAAYERELVVEGKIDRGALRELLFENSEFRAKVEGVLHPLVLERANAQVTSFSELVRISIVEVPLLYEVEFPLFRDLDLVVGSSESTQMRRLCIDRGLDPVVANRIIKAQVPIEEKIQRANIVVWNDGDRESLECQTDHLILRCARMFN